MLFVRCALTIKSACPPLVGFGVGRLCSVHNNARTRSIQFRLISSFALFDPISLLMCAQSKFYLIVSAAAHTQCSQEHRKLKQFIKFGCWLCSVDAIIVYFLVHNRWSNISNLLFSWSCCLAVSHSRRCSFIGSLDRTQHRQSTHTHTHAQMNLYIHRVWSSACIFRHFIPVRRFCFSFQLWASLTIAHIRDAYCTHNIPIWVTSVRTRSDFLFDIDAFPPVSQQIATF